MAAEFDVSSPIICFSQDDDSSSSGSFVKIINLISFFLLKFSNDETGDRERKRKTNQKNFNKTPVITVLEIYNSPAQLMMKNPLKRK
jgi:hypothetical protein